MSEIKPKFPPRVQAIWEDCGTYIDTGFHSNESAAKELEFFVEKLLQEYTRDLFLAAFTGGVEARDFGYFMKHKGYTHE